VIAVACGTDAPTSDYGGIDGGGASSNGGKPGTATGGESGGGKASSGGTSSAGGKSGAGGVAPGSGGSPGGAGGLQTTGGASNGGTGGASSGGALGTGGAATGGFLGFGGFSFTGGKPGTGGVGAGGLMTGGKPGTGGLGTGGFVTGGKPGTGGVVTGGSPGTGGTGSSPCECVDASVSWGQNGGNAVSVEQSVVNPCRTYIHTRSPLATTNVVSPPLNNTCTLQLSACGSMEYDVGDITDTLARDDVQKAFAQSPIVYGNDNRPTDGTVFRIVYGKAVVEVGTPCVTQGPDKACNPIPEGIAVLVKTLRAIDDQELQKPPCDSVFVTR
jgi:hypothetical protein